MKFFSLIKIILVIYFVNSPSITAKERWSLDKELSTIEFELPVLFIKNVVGQFSEIEGLIEIDENNKKNNKAIFSVKIDSIDINYKKYKDLILTNIFFDSKNFPIALVDTKQFSYDNEKKLKLSAELIIKGISDNVPLDLEIIHLTQDIIQIKGELIFSRKLFKIGLGKWSSAKVLSDKAIIKTNLFLIRQ